MTAKPVAVHAEQGKVLPRREKVELRRLDDAIDQALLVRGDLLSRLPLLPMKMIFLTFAGCLRVLIC